MKEKTVRRVCLLFCYHNQSERDRLSGALRYAAAHPTWEVRAIDRSSPDFENESTKLRHGWRPDGVIYTASTHYGNAIRLVGAQRAFKAELDPPRNAGDPKADVSVMADAQQIMSEAVAFLMRRGHVNFAFYGTEIPDERPYSELCERHYRLVLKSMGKQVLAFHEPSDGSWSERTQQAVDWLKTLPVPCAVMAYSDELSRNLLNACRIARISVPDQVAILGIDDSPAICETCRPTLSSLRIDFEMAGYLAAEALDKVMRTNVSGHHRKIFYGLNTISERMSTQDLHGCRRIASATAELIRTMPLETLNVSALVERLHVSRRLLEMHFKKFTDRGLHAEIVRRRLETLRTRVLSTQMPVGELALSCGFKTAAAARIAFRKHYGTSLTALRKR